MDGMRTQAFNRIRTNALPIFGSKIAERIQDKKKRADDAYLRQLLGYDEGTRKYKVTYPYLFGQQDDDEAGPKLKPQDLVFRNEALMKVSDDYLSVCDD
jgi:hypothetical protein